jgi:peptidoglycan/xylan/chitin deacetylase (PgdA/CDA1 family)
VEKCFCVTVDTEPDCDVRWRRTSPLTFESILVGIGKTLRPIWDKYGVRPVYFISPEVAADRRCCEVIKEEIKRGAEVGTHLHSEYIGPVKTYHEAAGTVSNEFPCYAHDTDTEMAKIRNLTELIKTNLGAVPISYRAARYGTDLDTIKSLEKLGYKIDSSITPGIDWSGQGGPDHSRAPNQPYFISLGDYYKSGKSSILEVPITIARKRMFYLPGKWFFYRWLRPSIMMVFEMKALIREFIKSYENPVLNMMFHSMEIIPKRTPFVRTEFGRKVLLSRLERILRYLRLKGFQSRTLREIYDEKLREIS